MALQEIHESSSACVVRDDRCVVHGLSATDELHMLHARVAKLEAELASVSQPAAQVIPLSRDHAAPVAQTTACASVKVPPRVAPPMLPGQSPAKAVETQYIALQRPNDDAPASMTATPATQASAEASAVTPYEPAPESEGNAFAAAWADDQSSFEERFAARQFFYDDGPASPSRKWLLS